MPNKRLTNSNAAGPRVGKAPDFKSLYVNWIQGSLSPFDITLAVGVARATGPSSMDVEHQANIVLSPLEAKVAVAMLGNLIHAFEENFGEVKIPKMMEEQFASPFPTISAQKNRG